MKIKNFYRCLNVADILADERFKAELYKKDGLMSELFLDKIIMLKKLIKWSLYYPCIIDPAGICFDFLIMKRDKSRINVLEINDIEY